MPRKPALKSVRAEFEAALDGAERLVSAVYPYCEKTDDSFSTAPLHFRQARRVVALSFLWTVAAWEEFVGGSFVRYVAGAKSPSGWGPQLSLGPARSFRHAYELISGKPEFDHANQFLTWTREDIRKRAHLFLSRGDCFTMICSKYKRVLDDASIIRNRVAHSSHTSNEKFKEVARRLRGRPLHQSYSVGDLLLEPPPRSYSEIAAGDCIFETYIAFYRSLCEQIVP